jgi:hypothetical protein
MVLNSTAGSTTNPHLLNFKLRHLFTISEGAFNNVLIKEIWSAVQLKTDIEEVAEC